ncbi:MAG: hypothetical protein KAS72_14260 [Phycisphaerales bacterium]|nr:hypothetical protein [Phycisphaerales bacterium]
MLRARLGWLSVVMIGIAATFSVAQGGDPVVRYDDHQLIRVQVDTPQERQAILEIAPLFLGDGVAIGRTNDFIVAPDRIGDLEASGLTYIVKHANVQQLIEEERIANQVRGTWFESYHRYSEINDYIDTLVALRPDLVTKFNIGQSIQGRDVYGMRITSSVGGPGKPTLYFDGGLHAREWISPATVMYIADQLVRNYGSDPDVTGMLDRAEFLIIPLTNPDGYEYSHTTNRMWRKNRRNNGGTYGVDLNRNWSVGWGGSGSSGDPSSDIYRGTAPFSEPETANMRDFILVESNVVAHIDFHSYSQLVLRPYGYTYSTPSEPDNTTMTELGDGMSDAIYSVHGKNYTSEPAASLYLASGICTDWHYDEAGAFSWTIELRDTGYYGFELPPDQIIATGEENFAAITFLADSVTVMLKFEFPGGLPSMVEPDIATVVNVDITEVNGELQPGTGKQFTRIGTTGPWTEAALTYLGGDSYQAVLPATPCGDFVQFYFQAETTDGAILTSPEGAPAAYCDAESVNMIVVFDDDIETDLGWTAGVAGDDATTGAWGRMNPEGTEAQPENDHTPAPGTICYVTDGRAGSSVGTYDIDGGKTTLLTPIFDGSEGEVAISYWRWYCNDAGASPNADIFVIDISDDGGSSWTNVETVGPGGSGTSGGWVYYEFDLASIPGITPTVNMQMRFIASDEGDGSIVEAVIDDFVVISILECEETCPGDLNGDGQRDQADLGILLASYEIDDGGDIDGDGDTDQADLGILLSVYGVPCP